MRIQSTAFTDDDVQHFLDDLLDHERHVLADRLERASVRLAKVGPNITEGRGSEEWSNHELLAHIAVLSKAYGIIVHKISSGQMTEVDLLGNTRLRDVVGEQMTEIGPADLLAQVLADHARTATELRTVDATSLRREAKLPDGRAFSAEFFARYPLINHLEQHVDQLERSLR